MSRSQSELSEKMEVPMRSTKGLGDRGEAETAKYLRRKGYTLLASQWRCRFGEIDLIVRDHQGFLCFVEVKLRSNLSCGLPREFVNTRKQDRLKTAAAYYMSEHELDEPARFDVAEVYVDHNQRIQKLCYLENVF
jgi:putative endonuclease